MRRRAETGAVEMSIMLRETWIKWRNRWLGPGNSRLHRFLADRRQQTFLGKWLLALIAAGYVWSWRDVPGNWWDATQGNRPLMQAKSWYYNLARVEPALIAKIDADVLIIDFAKFEGKVPLTPAEVAAMKLGPTGKKRLVVSYFSIGEAEEFRFYWRPEWKQTPPAWDAGENCAWPKAHMVRFWHDSWKDTIIRAPNAYLRQIIAAGFDGVYLDRVDVFEHQKDDRLDLREEMKNLVKELAATARGLKPGFLVIPQNAEDLLEDRDYRRVVDGLGKESLLYGGDATDQRNKAGDIRSSMSGISALLWDWKPVFAVEYVTTRELGKSARKELRKLGIVPTFQHRSLDGSDPFDASVVRPPGSNAGTPEYIAANCKDKKWW
jgi:cysteinyl-tRNA synthetase, unknown class